MRNSQRVELRVRLTEEGETPSSKAIILAEQVELQLRQRILTERAEMTV
ncbi:hypothetical protein [Ligilactobacillus salivarius]|nr:hypothetical protein [Ligilactobacillus salivarius]